MRSTECRASLSYLLSFLTLQQIVVLNVVDKLAACSIQYSHIVGHENESRHANHFPNNPETSAVLIEGNRCRFSFTDK